MQFPSFRIYVSTRRLIHHSFRRNMCQVNATYKLNWQGYPLLAIDLSDFTKQFYPFGWCLFSGETRNDFEFLILPVEYIQFLPFFIKGDAAESILNERLHFLALELLDPPIMRTYC